MKYKHLFFDLDHTLWDFETNSKETLKELFALHSLTQLVTNDFEGFYQHYSAQNKKLWDRYHHGFVTQDELKWKRMWNTLLEFKVSDQDLCRLLSDDYIDRLPNKKILFPYTVEILTYLKNKGYQLHLITNGFQHVQGTKLQNAGIDHFFINVITSELAMSLKPKKEIFDFAIARAGCSYNDSLMLGDNLDADVKGAMAAGMDAVFVNHINEQPTCTPTHIIYHLKELETIL